jgi:hypothetical protein
MPNARDFLLLSTLGCGAVAIAFKTLVTSPGGKTHQCKNDNNPKDEYESAYNLCLILNFREFKLSLQRQPAHPIVTTHWDFLFLHRSLSRLYGPPLSADNEAPPAAVVAAQVLNLPGAHDLHARVVTF